jgi:hypothetical protein
MRYSVYFLLTLFAFIGSFACTPAAVDQDVAAHPSSKDFAAYNHTALLVKNLDSSVAFYQYLFEFDTLPYPFPFRENLRVKWLSTGNGGELHLAQFIGDTATHTYPGHLGFTVSFLDTVLSRLQQWNYPLPELDQMPNGERTIMITDVDGHGIHLIERPPQPDQE